MAKKVNRERCERLFSWPKIAKDYIDFLSELIKSKCYNYAGFLSEESWQDRSIMKSNHI